MRTNWCNEDGGNFWVSQRPPGRKLEEKEVSKVLSIENSRHTE